MAKRYINLLPPEEQKHIRLEGLNYAVASFGVRVLLSFVFFIAFIFGAQIILNQEIDDLNEQVAARSRELQNIKQPAVQKEIEALNRNLDNLQALLPSGEDWTPILVEFARLLPADLTVDSILITREDGKIEVAGHGDTRESALKLRDNLLESRYFKDVNFPLSNLEKARNVDWKYRFYYNPEKLKE
ncbi:MAG: hypothetical protein Q8P75_02520 [bacterium]|nr:hypothetical protein [bacterium]